jgi:hypothetical protein
MAYLEPHRRGGGNDDAATMDFLFERYLELNSPQTA